MTAGDPRASENMGLLQLQVLFFREHNTTAAALADAHPDWDDERLYQEARRRTIAMWQHLLLDERVLAVFGPDMVEQLGPYRGFDPEADPTTSVVFATLALRYGHSALHPYARGTPTDRCPRPASCRRCPTTARCPTSARSTTASRP